VIKHVYSPEGTRIDRHTGARERKISWSKRGTGGAETKKPNASRGGKWGRGIPLPIRVGGLGRVVRYPGGVRGIVLGRAPAQNEFGAFGATGGR